MLKAHLPIFRPLGLGLVIALSLSLPSLAQQTAQPPVVQPPVVQSDMPESAAPAPPDTGPDTAPVVPTQPSAAAAQPPAAPPATAPLSPNAVPAQAETAQIEILHPQTDYSAWGMCQAAHWVVKLVMVSLIFASFVTWTVLVFKLIELAVARARRSVRTIHNATSLEIASAQLSSKTDPAAFMAQAALIEYRRSDPAIAAAGPDGVKERSHLVLDRIEVQAGARIRKGTGLLATIGASAAFVGLFGTVWGIMNAFIGIAETKTTNLAVVAPGIAEALLATAIGLIAAIPAEG